MVDSQKKILIVEDDAGTRMLYEHVLVKSGFTVVAPEFKTGDRGYPAKVLSAAKSNVFAAICDLSLPDDSGELSVVNGMQLIRKIRELNLGIHVVVLSGAVDEQSLSKLLKLGLAAVFSKDSPTMTQDLIAKVTELSTLPPAKKIFIPGAVN